ncbi:MAG: DNA helicase RecQ [Muribaculaceae bacterium]|nr:DNA helicase RecQ [Muribaculaceae bacterium]
MARAKALLKRFYGYSSFRPMQAEIIEAVSHGHDCVVLMPTGGGKSLTFQIPALLAEGVAVVVSPLIALMTDQVTALVANGIPAASLNSSQSEAERRAIMDGLNHGHIKLLYLSPERLMLEMDRWGADMNVSLFAIDEAHCISQWGHDFRPEYTQLSRIKARFPNVPVMALTATADRLTREDISRQLALTNPRLFISSFDRPNISIRVMQDPGKRKRLSILTSMIDRYPDDSGIVYCISRKSAETVNAELRERGYRSTVYHAGLSGAERDQAQRLFINGDVNIVCATVAFGMGIDKSNIRYVIHNNMPRNIESYYQEIGRAGRDGMPAEALMFYSFSDVAMLQNFIDEGARQAINSEKLNRMKEFAEASVCRRRVLLSYFNEETHTNCGNCDVCLDPPERFDGTIMVQKALSAIVRTGEKVGLNLLIEILRGSSRAEVVSGGYHLLKTYGVGRDLSHAHWRAYMSQMLQLGLIELNYTEGNHLKVTPYGWKVLKGEESVVLAKFYPNRTAETTTRRSERQTRVRDVEPPQELLSALKKVRAALSKIEKVPAYMVFSDRTLHDMALKQPASKAAFSSVDGVGEVKTEKYWRHFVRVIIRYRDARGRL